MSVAADAVISAMFDSTETGATIDETIAFCTAVVVSPAAGSQELVELS
jgi:uncharacterized protein YbjQ (UPF0145 family)